MEVNAIILGRIRERGGIVDRELKSGIIGRVRGESRGIGRRVKRNRGKKCWSGKQTGEEGG